MHTLKKLVKAILPTKAYELLLRPYHFFITLFAALRYGFPARHLKVIAVTGTKGKSTVSDMIASILKEAGISFALSNTVHFVINNDVRPNTYKMTVPGRGFLQKFLAEAVAAKCTHAVIELSSEATLNFRHLFTMPNILVVTNLQPEHLERHGSMENYFQAKMNIVRELSRSPKRPRHLFVGVDDDYGKRFLESGADKKAGYSINDVSNISLATSSGTFVYNDTEYMVGLPGEVSIKNALASIHVANALSIPKDAVQKALSHLHIPGRFEEVSMGQKFTVVVDYAHTPDSLKALYAAYPNKRKICVLGNTGGGRDVWKRPEMGAIADTMCDEVVLTNEDPYDEDPEKILADMTTQMKRTPKIILDRREALSYAFSLAQENDVVLISGKGSDPYIMEKNNTKTPWSDVVVAAEELKKMLH
jgi:UDP-N-acetylmuramoyl-L-alanyl-D-glutamate--2,6-diaminopimelate ligase